MKGPVVSDALVSVCIPVYNGAKSVRETIESVLKQTYRPVEIIVQDNASTDGTWQLLERMADEHPEVSIERNDRNLGMAANWNTAFRRARGEYVSLLSADDLMMETFVERTVGCFATRSPAAVTTNHYWLKGPETVPRRMRCLPGLHKNFAALVMLLNPFSINFTVFDRRFVDECFRKGPMFREDVYTCDYDLWLKMALAGDEVYYVPEPLGAYRIHGENLSRQARRMERQTAFVLTSHRDRYKGRVKAAYLFTLLRFLVRACRVTEYRVDRKLVRALWLAMRVG